ncbi:MAG: hypothetical protein E2O85_05320 [Bacteroidetes bacterium]|nr:MAG: hypothetical protein E2O85_05320 [Bacteroidota bacterium]
MTKEPLSVTRPDLVAEWHSENNGPWLRDDIRVTSSRRLSWKCTEGPDHDWQTSVNNRSYGSGCPFCAEQRASVTKSLAT